MKTLNNIKDNAGIKKHIFLYESPLVIPYIIIKIRYMVNSPTYTIMIFLITVYRVFITPYGRFDFSIEKIKKTTTIRTKMQQDIEYNRNIITNPPLILIVNSYI